MSRADCCIGHVSRQLNGQLGNREKDGRDDKPQLKHQRQDGQHRRQPAGDTTPGQAAGDGQGSDGNYDCQQNGVDNRRRSADSEQDTEYAGHANQVDH